MRLEYEPSLEPLHNSAKWFFLRSALSHTIWSYQNDETGSQFCVVESRPVNFGRDEIRQPELGIARTCTEMSGENPFPDTRKMRP